MRATHDRFCLLSWHVCALSEFTFLAKPLRLGCIACPGQTLARRSALLGRTGSISLPGPGWHLWPVPAAASLGQPANCTAPADELSPSGVSRLRGSPLCSARAHRQHLPCPGRAGIFCRCPQLPVWAACELHRARRRSFAIRRLSSKRARLSALPGRTGSICPARAGPATLAGARSCRFGAACVLHRARRRAFAIMRRAP